MQLHFYASIKAINAMYRGEEMLVKTEDGKGPGDIQVSFDMELYTVTKIVNATNLYRMKKKEAPA